MDSLNLPIFILENEEQKKVLRQKALIVQFPLSDEDKRLIETLKYMASEGLEGHAAGLAAPQVGVSKQIIVYQVKTEWREWRQDLETEVPLTALINPFYEPIPVEGKTLDWEGCFSIRKQRGKVYRYAAIRYKGQDEEGNLVEGIARGFLARLLQHEIDHLNGILTADLYDPNSPHGTPEEMKAIFHSEVEERKRRLEVGD